MRISENIVSGSGLDGIIIPAASTGTATLAIHDNAITAGGNGLQIARTAGTVFITAFHNNVVSGDTGGSGIVVTGPSVFFDAMPGGACWTQWPAARRSSARRATAWASPACSSRRSAGALDFTDLDIVSGNGAALSVVGTGAFTGAAGTRITATAGAARSPRPAARPRACRTLTTDLQLARPQPAPTARPTACR